MLKFIALFLLLITNFAFAAEEKITVILDWFPNPDQAPLFVAEQAGFFKAQNLYVTFISPTDPAEAEKMIAAGKADIGVTYQPSLLQKVTSGLPLVRIATIINSPLNCLVTLKENNINKIADLKNKTIGYSTPGTDNIMLLSMLKTASMSEKDINLINVHFDLVQALLAKKIDAFTGAMRNLEPIQITMLKKNVVVFYPEKYGFPKYDELILIANKKKINDPIFKKFVFALKQGTAYLLANPEASWQQFAQNHPEANSDLNHKIWFGTLKYFAKDPAYLDKNQYENFAAFLLQNKLIPFAPKLEDYTIDIK